MKKQCFWHNTPYKASKSLIGRHAASYLIVGGGVAGLFVAHYLLKKGLKDITIIEKDVIGGGSTGHSAGMLESELEIPRELIEKRHGKRSARTYIRAQKAAQQEVRRLIKRERMACDYEEKALHYFKNGLQKGTFVEKSISVDPVRFARGMKIYLQKRGVSIFEHTPLINVRKNTAITKRGSISFRHIVYALGTSQKHPAICNYVTTICVTRRLSQKRLREFQASGRSMFFYDERQSYHYGKITRDKRLLIGYGDVQRVSPKVHAPLHIPHVRSIKRFIRRALGANLSIHRAWSAAYALSRKPLPLVSVRRGILGGAGTQIASIAAASYFASTLAGERHALGNLFKD